MAEIDYIDITPRSTGGPRNRSVQFQDSEWDQIENNNEGLTKEGIEEKIKLWKQSSNRFCILKYETMLARCTKIRPSGKDSEGKIILARDEEGNPKWVKEDLDIKSKKK